MIKGIHHVGLTLCNAREAAQFYSAAAAFPTLTNDALYQELRLPSGDDAIEIQGAGWLQAPNAYIRLLEPSAPLAPRERGVKWQRLALFIFVYNPQALTIFIKNLPMLVQLFMRRQLI
ncbi:MAG: hypothetical protein HC782_01075 [Gammaproteobacteria bacterium]|nr:hypothetical protein [Gammaproteobacteria bacterium]